MASPESRERALRAHRERSDRHSGDFHNLDYLDAVLVDGDPIEQEAARIFLRDKGMNEERIERMFAAQRLRARVHAMVREDRYHRVETNPEPTPEEMDAGCYREMLEPQVRDAVFALRAKGYPTQGSGFTSVDTQNIYFAEGFDLTAVLDEDTKQRLGEKGVEIGSCEIVFTPREMTVDGIKAQWDEIAALMPVCAVPMAVDSNPAENIFQTVVREGRQRERWGRKIRHDQDTKDKT